MSSSFDNIQEESQPKTHDAETGESETTVDVEERFFDTRRLPAALLFVLTLLMTIGSLVLSAVTIDKSLKYLNEDVVTLDSLRHGVAASGIWQEVETRVGDQSVRITHKSPPRGGSSACAQTLFRSCAPVSIKYGYSACVPEHTRMTDVPGHSRMVLSRMVP
eukprot:gene15731-4742_t